ncbi:ABC transporter permease [Bythopirellula goksoeyrii]|uniref:FtsX-like permease family protein n=1 Tax=Bythopirellula goksoeyrii TaxID=1400387 RepID=A0A5B9Q7E7_9BACT|nr:FtsX-like permease family protein [Bythopirellula goksoeyrii]QEG33485.1 FtsX-like permease family protein [Bythopirellula goksoeyrii]
MAVITALDRKALRDLWHMKGQAVAIALVIGCGVALFTLSRSMLHSLELTQVTYYQRFHFAEVFASLKRAPDALRDRIAEIPGVARVETRIVVGVNLSVPGLSEPATGRIISVPDTRESLLNQLYLRRGSMLTPGRDDQILASEAFADANLLEVGDSISAVINGRLKKLRIVGIVLSPEYIYEIKPGDILPDNKHFGVLWMNHEALSTAYNLEGAFNDVTISLMRGASLPEVLFRLDELIKPYGGLGSYGRKDQPSHMFLDNEIEQNRQMGLIMPTVFLGVAAFLLNVVLTRTINLQREQIAALKAFGYNNLEVGWHYMKIVLLIVGGGLAFGIPCGAWFGQVVTGMYAKLFHFPEFTYHLTYGVALTAALVSVVASVLGAWSSIRKAVSLPPAEAMRPEPPTSFKPTILERLNLGHLLPPVMRMILRQLERHPVKTGLSVFAISLAVAIIVLGNFMEDSVDYVMEAQFNRVQKYDMSVVTIEPVSSNALYEIASMPGVIHSEPTRGASTRFRAGPRSRRVSIQGLPANGTLFGLIDIDGNQISLPPDGLVISRKLGDILNIKVGDMVQVEVLEGKRPVKDIPVVGSLQDFSGVSAYMNIDALHRLLREGPVITGANMIVDARYEDQLFRELKTVPAIAGVTMKEHAIESFQKTVAENLMTMKAINLFFACVIAIGVVYNSARISLSERSRELATLRVIGFTRGEISGILLGELAIITLLAVPLGLWIGYKIAGGVVALLDLELFRFPLVIERTTYGLAAGVVILASVISGLLVRRRLDELDLIAVLKSRE